MISPHFLYPRVMAALRRKIEEWGDKRVQRWIASAASKVLAKNRERKEYPGYFHPSSIACLRQTLFDVFYPDEDDTPAEKARMYYSTFSVGDFFHARLQAKMLLAAEDAGSGIALGLDGVERPFHDPARRIVGTIDMLADVDGALTVVDFKSISASRFQVLPESALGKDKPQLLAYMRCVGAKRGVLYYESKDPRRSPFDGVREFVFDDSEEGVESVDTIAQEFRLCVMERRMPERLPLFPDKVPCSWCSHKERCGSNYTMTLEDVAAGMEFAKARQVKPSLKGAFK